MIREMKKATWCKRVESRNAYQEIIEEWQAQQEPIEVAISASTGLISELNSVLSISATHYGYTKDARIRVKDKIVLDNKTYSVDYITETRRMRVLALMAEWQVQ